MAKATVVKQKLTDRSKWSAKKLAASQLAMRRIKGVVYETRVEATIASWKIRVANSLNQALGRLRDRMISLIDRTGRGVYYGEDSSWASLQPKIKEKGGASSLSRRRRPGFSVG